MLRLLLTFALCLLLIVPCLAQDADSDGIADEVEAALGSDPDVAQEFAPLFHDGRIGRDDRSRSGQVKDAPDFIDVYLSTVARDRWLFKVTFAADYVSAGNTFILYLDVDGDLATGRQESDGVRGTDLMYVQANGGFRLTECTPGLRTDPLRMQVVDDAIYICADIPLGEGSAEGKIRFKVLSHVSPPNASDADNMDWQVAQVPEARDARKPRIGAAPPMPPVAQFETDRPDRDGDGIPDEVEFIVGSNAEEPEKMYLMHDDKAKGEGDASIRPEHNIAPDVTRLYFGNVAGNRYIWRLDFARDFIGPGTVLILYLDADDLPETGRTGWAQGIDVMLQCVDGSFSANFHNSAVAAPDRNLRGFIDGNKVWFSLDLQMHHDRTGHSEARGYILSHRRPETNDADTTDWFVHYGPGESEKDKPRATLVSEYLSEGMRVEEPWLGWREDIAAMKPLVLPASSARRQGMKLFDRALEPEADNARATFSAPVAGSYRINLVLQDSAVGNEKLSVSVAGKPVAEVTAGQNDGVFYLFTTEQAVDLKQGDPIELAVAAPAQDFRICEVFLTAEPPRPRELEITHIETYCPPQSSEGRVDICWLTNNPAAGYLLWGEGTSLDNLADEPVQATYNHRVTLTGLKPGARYSAQILTSRTAKGPKSHVFSFAASPKRPEDAGLVRRERVALSVQDMLEGGRGEWPVNGGMPIPRGELASAGSCRLLDAGGEEVPASFRELSWWPDGSVKWLLVSTLKQAGEGYQLEYGTAVSPRAANGNRVTETDAGLRVNNGPLQVDIARDHFAPPGRVWLDRDRNGAFAEDEVLVAGDQQGAVLVDGSGKRFATTGEPASKLIVEEDGPTRTVVLAEGRLVAEDGAGLFTYRCRMYFYQGHPAIPTTFTLINGAGQTAMPPTMTPITSLTLAVSPQAAKTDGEPTRLLQDYDTRTITSVGNKVTETDSRPLGVMSVPGERGTFTVCLRDFWQTYPKAFSKAGGAITVELFPELPEDQYAEHTDPKLRTLHYFWRANGKYQIPCGAAVSSDMLFHFGDADGVDEQRIAQQWQTPIMLTCPPERYCGTGVFMDLAPEKPGKFEIFQEYVDAGLVRLDAARERFGEYDWMSYGDWYGERAVNWGNQEYDLQWALLLQFARSGDMRYLDRGEQAARHFAAIDTINASPDESQLGRVHVHGVGHTGGFELERVPNTTYWYIHGGHDVGHTWTQGLYSAYCLTGDRRLLESAELVATWMARHWTQSLTKYVHRNFGWATIAVLGGYHATGDPFYLNAARLYCDYMAARQDPGTGVWAHPVGECTHTPQHMGGKVFMSGVDMTALKMLDQIEPRDVLKNAIVRNCDWMYSRMWHPDDNSFQYAQCTDFDSSSTHAGIYMASEGLAYAYDLTRDERYKEMLLRPLGDMLSQSPGSIGKSYAMEIRMTPFALTAIERWGLDEVPMPPPPAPKVTWDDELYLVPGGASRLVMYVENRARQAVPARMDISQLPGGLQASVREATWEAAPGKSAGPAITFTGSAAPGRALKLTYSAGETSGEVLVPVRNAEKIQLGKQVGYVGGEGDSLGATLAKLGIDLPAVPDLSPASLAQYGALVVGCEAHEKNFLNLRQDARRLMDFAYSGGRLAVVQLQDSSHQSRYLPYPVTLSNDSSAFGNIVAGNHPIFTTPHKINSLTGAISYDTITQAAPEWAVLATDQNGQPSVIETDLGAGKVLVVQPSMDRYVTGEVQPTGPLTVDECASFVRNLVEYLRAGTQ